MTKENEKRVPKLRFKGFTDDWEQCELKNLVTRVKSYSLSRSVETNSDTNTKYIHYGDIHTHVADKIEKGTKLPNIVPGVYETLNKGDLVLADASEDYQGIATPAIVMDQTDYSLVAGLHTIALRPTKINSLYLYYLIKSPTFRKYGYKIGTGMKVFGISVNRLLDFKTLMPITEEQSKIAELLLLMDKTITLHQRKLEQLEKLKQALLQQMFPQKDEVVPRLRFANFNENWEQCKLRKILKERNEQIIESLEYPLMSFVQGIGVTPKDKRYDRSFLVKNKKKKYKKTELGDFIYSSNNLETGSIGFNKTGKAVISPVYSIFSSKSNIESKFIGIMSLRKDFINEMIRYRQGVVYGQWRIHEKDFLNIKISIPTQSEQLKISYLYKNLENIINLQQKKLSELKLIKQLLLKTLFI